MPPIIVELEYFIGCPQEVRQHLRIIVAEVGEVLADHWNWPRPLLDHLADHTTEAVISKVRLDKGHRRSDLISSAFGHKPRHIARLNGNRGCRLPSAGKEDA